MNLILLTDKDFTDQKNLVRINGRRFNHIINIHKAELNDRLCVGLINDRVGTGEIVDIKKTYLEMNIDLQSSPPDPLPLTLILALPRPKVLKRILLCLSSMGVKKIYLINSWRVEKSYWQSPVLDEKIIYEQFVLGLEQGRDTILPEIHFKRLFKPFVEDELPEIIKDTFPVLAHPKAERSCPRESTQNITLAIGPEGGFIPYEIDKLVDCGFTQVNIGNRIIKVEDVIPFLLGRIF